ncbi:helix-turn-helix transcriptional regulator [Streptomyces europaeiscabiei]|uniref:helix-turn-helix domain-containing protein n=1 Tax=Streptomyces europaeiscabiei TaxID=146819 RepID=UPI0029AF0919|nr:helix-turn-helix transcriptional regulator [Streptomyces europaeiscabiei]MDX3694827.1 helix-turn-helix transcriptional regulator [Streptomyces europaeiscabiei]
MSTTSRGSAGKRRLLGEQLRALRESSGLTIVQAGEGIGRSNPTISRIENGKRTPLLIELKALAELYGADEETTASLLRLLSEIKDEGWWDAYKDVMPSSLGNYVELEAEAASLKVFALAAVHSLLRTEDYLRAVLRATSSSTPAKEIDRLTAFHMERQRQCLLTAENPVELIAVLDEASLRREVGGRAVLRAQLQHLLVCMEAPNITVQILPYDKGAHGALSGSFTILDFHDPSEPSVAYVDSPGGNLYLQKSPDMRRFEKTHAALRGSALDGPESERWLRDALKEL